MDKKQFETLLPIIVASLVDIIMKKNMLSDNEAINTLYSSELYTVLEKEEMKVWYYSVPKLYELLQKEKEFGKLELPEY